MQNKIKTSRLTRAGLLTAIIVVLTVYLRIPLPAGYAHAGDGAVMLCGILMGTYGVIPAALGSALADASLGFVIYAPYSAVIKGVMALVAARFIDNTRVMTLNNIIAVIAASLVMVLSYLVVDSIYYTPEVAVFSIGGNLMQAGIGVITSMFGIRLSRRLKWRGDK